MTATTFADLDRQARVKEKTNDEKLEILSTAIQSDIDDQKSVNATSLEKAVNVGHMLLQAKEMVKRGNFKDWIAAQNFGVEYNWCSICMRAATATIQLMQAKYSWEYIADKTVSIKDLAAMRDKAHRADPWEKLPSKPRVNKEAQAAFEQDKREEEFAERAGTLKEREDDLEAREAEFNKRIADVFTSVAAKPVESDLSHREKVLAAREAECEKREAEAAILVAKYTALINELESKQNAPKRTARSPRKPRSNPDADIKQQPAS